MNATAAPEPRSRLLGALAYLLWAITGIVFLFVEPFNQDEYVRFHARQSIVFSVAWLAVNIIFWVFIGVLPEPLGRVLGAFQTLINLALAVFWVFLMYKAYTGERYRIPQLADLAESLGI